MLNLTLKHLVYDACIKQLSDKITDLTKAVNDAQQAANAEEKSSMGDKYETGRAMSMQSRDLAAKQLILAQADLNLLKKIDIEKTSDVVTNGSLVNTTKGVLFIAVSLGNITVGDNSVMAISANAPLAKLVMHKKEKSTFTFNQQEFFINQII